MSKFKARQRARRINIEVHSCSMCPSLVVDASQGRARCNKTQNDLCAYTPAALTELQIPDYCPLEVSYGQS